MTIKAKDRPRLGTIFFSMISELYAFVFILSATAPF
jgi:hypothetical protein